MVCIFFVSQTVFERSYLYWNTAVGWLHYRLWCCVRFREIFFGARLLRQFHHREWELTRKYICDTIRQGCRIKLFLAAGRHTTLPERGYAGAWGGRCEWSLYRSGVLQIIWFQRYQAEYVPCWSAVC